MWCGCGVFILFTSFDQLFIPIPLCFRLLSSPILNYKHAWMNHSFLLHPLLFHLINTVSFESCYLQCEWRKSRTFPLPIHPIIPFTRLITTCTLCPSSEGEIRSGPSFYPTLFLLSYAVSNFIFSFSFSFDKSKLLFHAQVRLRLNVVCTGCYTKNESQIKKKY